MFTALPDRRLWWIVGLLAAAGGGLRLLHLDWQPLWWDEGYSVYFATEPLARMLALTARDIHPPLYYLLLHGWIQLWGNAAPETGRLLSVWIGGAGLLLQLWLAWLFFRRRPQLLLLTVPLAVLNPMQLFYSQEIRMYGLGMALSTAATGFFWVWQRPGTLQSCSTRRWAAVGYGVTALAGLYTLYYFVFVLVGHLLWAFLCQFLCAERRSLRRVGSVAGMLLLVFAGYLPWLVYTLSHLLSYVGNKVAADQDSPLDLLTYLLRHLATFQGGHLAWPALPGPWTLLLSGAAFLLLLAGLAKARAQPRAEEPDEQSAVLLLAVVLSTVLVGGWLVSLRFPFFPEGGERLLMVALPSVLLLWGVGVERVWSVRWAGPVVLLLLLANAVGGAVAFYTVPRYGGHDYRPLLRQLMQDGRNQDTFLAIFPWQVGYWRAYRPVGSSLLTGPAPVLLADSVVGWSPAVQDVLQRALQRGTVWFPAPLSFGATLPFEIEAYLADRSFNLENRWYGTTRLSAWAALPEPTARSTLTSDYGAVQLTASAIADEWVEAANQPVAVRLTWQVVEPTDLNVSLRLLDRNGYRWSSREYAVNWSGLPSGARTTEAVGVIAPAGLPPGVYTVGVSVARQAENGQRGEALTLVGSDTVDASIGTLTVVAPRTAQPVERLPIQSPLHPPVAQAGVELLGLSGLSAAEPRLAGTALGLTLFLRIQRALAAERTLTVSLLDGQGRGVAGFVGWPLPEFSITALDTGDLLRLPVHLDLPATLPSGTYQLVAGLGGPDLQNQSALTVLGSLEIEQRRAHFERPIPVIPLTEAAQFGTHARLYGYSVEPSGAESVNLSLYWEILQPLLPPHHLFIHVLAADGQVVGQQDGIPATESGAVPTGSWQPGEFLTTVHSVRAPTGSVFDIGLYDPETLQRLPVTWAHSVGDSVRLPER